MLVKNLTLFTLVISMFFMGNQAFSQEFPISNGSVTTCQGVFLDDGLEGSYSASSSYTFTICPDNPGDVISVEFVAFSLYVSPNPNNSDYLSIFDGDNVGEATLGDYTGTALQGLPVTGTVNNTTGCLTFVFNAGAGGMGTFPGWEAIISCTTPCANPTAAYEFIDPLPTTADQSIGVCLGQDITFGDAGSVAADGFDLEYWVWNFDDGTIDTLESPANITHAFSEPGEYLVNLSVIDDNGCRNLNVEPLQVLVSTIPIFNTDFESPICTGSSATIDGSPIQSVTWTALPPQVVAGETYLADGAGFSYSSSLVFDFFEPGATLESCDEFLNVFINMEHSYLGDLSFSLSCPDGTTVNMLTFPNGAGFTYLGEPVDDNFGVDDLDQGVGYDYGWSPTSTNGFINDAANWTETTFTNTLGETDTNPIANPGFYESEEDLCNFVGCPLNGEWTFSVTDNIGLDNGYIFEWGIGFDPSLFPDITTFTPVVGLESDSSYWNGPSIVETSENGNTIEILPPGVGEYDYTFTALNNFGCEFDTTITIEVIEGPEITAGPDQFVCTDPVTLQAGLADSPGECSDVAGNYTYCYENNVNLVQTYCPDNPGDGVTFMEVSINSGSVENGWDEFFVYDGDNTGAPLLAGPIYGDLSGQSFQATNPSGCITIQITPDGSNDCAGGAQTELNLTVGCSGGSGLIWSWSPATGLSDPNIQNPTAFVDQATVYTVAAYPAGLPGCLITDQVTVAPDPGADPGIDTDTTFCYNSPTSLLIAYLEGNPASGGDWVDNATGETLASQEFSPLDFPDGASFDYTYTVSNGICTNSSNLQITVLPATDESCCQTNAFAGPDAVACALTYQLNAEPTIGTGTWSGPPEVTFSDVNDPQAIATCESPGGTYILTWTDSNGFLCEATDQIEVVFANPLSVNVVVDDAVCFDECTGSAIAIVGGGTSLNGLYSLEWSGGVATDVNPIRDSLCAGTFKLVVTDNVGCTDSTFFTVGQPDPQEIDVFVSPALCTDSCNAEVVISSPGAIEFSYDGAQTWVPDSVGLVCPGEGVVYARNAAGCEIGEDINAANPAPFEANFNVNPNPTTVQNTLITFQDISQPGPIANSLFLIGDPPFGEVEGRTSSFRFPTDTAGDYTITLISESVKGCIDTTSQILTINDDLLWFIPNSFSPNGDGINDIWKPVGNTVDLSSYVCRIYDRWGRLVFETADIDQGWNGAVEGSDYFADTEVFNYFIEITSATTEEKYELSGFITLIR